MTTRLSIIVIAALMACAAPRQKLAGNNTGDDEFTAPAPEATSFALLLNNRHWLDMNIFVLHDGQASRVGMVTASSSQSLMLSARMLGQAGAIRVIAEAIGEPDSYTTDLLVVQPGQIVELNLESQLAGSNYSVQ